MQSVAIIPARGGSKRLPRTNIIGFRGKPIIAYTIALRAPQTIFDLAVQYAFSGYAALSPLLVSRSTGP